MEMEVPVLAGAVSTAIFAMSTLPMLYKAGKTRDLGSYSLGNILLSNVGNLIHSVYIFSLPPGPIWLLHSFYLVTTALMLIWYLRYELDQTRWIDLMRLFSHQASEWFEGMANSSPLQSADPSQGWWFFVELRDFSRQQERGL